MWRVAAVWQPHTRINIFRNAYGVWENRSSNASNLHHHVTKTYTNLSSYFSQRTAQCVLCWLLSLGVKQPAGPRRIISQAFASNELFCAKAWRRPSLLQCLRRNGCWHDPPIVGDVLIWDRQKGNNSFYTLSFGTILSQPLVHHTAMNNFHLNWLYLFWAWVRLILSKSSTRDWPWGFA